MIDELRDHIIVCGYGRVGRRAAEELRHAGVPYVVLDFSEEAMTSAEAIGDLFIEGSGAEDDDLVRAGIDRARGILVASDDDGDNMYITLSAKSRRPGLTVIARASTEEAERKLRLAGADRVVTPYATAGRVMAQLMIKPQVASFLNSLTSSDQPGMSFEEIEVKSTCGAVGLTIGELDVAEADRREHRRGPQARRAARGAADEGHSARRGRRDRRGRVAGGDPEARADVRATGSRCLARPPSSASRRGSARRSARRSSSSARRIRRTATSRRTSRCGRRRPSRVHRASWPRSTPRRSRALDEVASAEVAGPGFINVRVGDAFFLDAFGEIGEGYGGGWADPAERVQVEMVSANPTGPIVVSAARNGAYGDCVARLLEFGGHEVSREYYYNDAGAQMDRFRESIDALRRGEPVPEDGYQGAYVEELARAEGDPVPKMLASIEHTMERFRIHFDSWALQSELEQRLPEYLPKLDTYEKDGALWARSSAYGDEQDWVLIRSAEKGGTPTYRAADVAYLVDKLERGFDRAIYVLGADHHATAHWYAAIARMLGYDPERVEVLLYQFVHLTRGGESTKASKRAGNVVFLDDVMDEIGVDAARWYLVNRGPDQTIEIDLDLAAEKSQKNPVYYVQYAHARIAAILRNAGDAEVGGRRPGRSRPRRRS